jgi:hypothetical protein
MKRVILLAAVVLGVMGCEKEVIVIYENTNDSLICDCVRTITPDYGAAAYYDFYRGDCSDSDTSYIERYRDVNTGLNRYNKISINCDTIK